MFGQHILDELGLRLWLRQVQHLIEDIMAKVYGRPLTVTTRLLAKSKSTESISPENKANNTEEGASLDNLLEIFNGQIVS